MFRCGPTALGYSFVLNEIAIAVPVVLPVLRFPHHAPPFTHISVQAPAGHPRDAPGVMTLCIGRKKV